MTTNRPVDKQSSDWLGLPGVLLKVKGPESLKPLIKLYPTPLSFALNLDTMDFTKTGEIPQDILRATSKCWCGQGHPMHASLTPSSWDRCKPGVFAVRNTMITHMILTCYMRHWGVSFNLLYSIRLRQPL